LLGLLRHPAERAMKSFSHTHRDGDSLDGDSTAREARLEGNVHIAGSERVRKTKSFAIAVATV
jgi:hypothetical protein